MTTENSRADALTRESIEAIARKYAGAYFSGLLFQDADSFARFSDELILAASPVEQPAAAPFSLTEDDGQEGLAFQYAHELIAKRLGTQPAPSLTDEQIVCLTKQVTGWQTHGWIPSEPLGHFYAGPHHQASVDNVLRIVRASLLAAHPGQREPRAEVTGWKLAMRVLQSDLYPQLDDAERAECDALARANPYAARTGASS